MPLHLMHCCRNTWHTEKPKMSSTKIADLTQEPNSFITGEENTVLHSTWNQLHVVRIWWLYHSLKYQVNQMFTNKIKIRTSTDKLLSICKEPVNLPPK